MNEFYQAIRELFGAVELTQLARRAKLEEVVEALNRDGLCVRSSDENIDLIVIRLGDKVYWIAKIMSGTISGHDYLKELILDLGYSNSPISHFFSNGDKKVVGNQDNSPVMLLKSLHAYVTKLRP